MTIGIHDVVSEYIRLIEKCVQDPNPERRVKGSQWIYDDLPANTMSLDKYPRISVLAPTATSVPQSLHSNKQRLTVRTEVQIRVPKSKWYDQTPMEFLDDLTLSVIEALRDEDSRLDLLNNACVFQMVLEAENTIPSGDLVIRQLIFKNILDR